MTAPGCDARTATAYLDAGSAAGAVVRCRCLVCARCGKHTGNSNRGHYWVWCRVARRFGEFHFCCPSACELWPL